MITNYKLFNILSFIAGGAIGSVITWKIVKTKYERIAQEEIDSVKEVFSKRKYTEEPVSKKEIPADAVVKNLNEKPDIIEYAATINNLGYTGPTKKNEEESEVEDEMNDKPYVISADEFDEEGYETETLTYYADGVLVDWYNDIIEDVDDVVGLDTLENFDEYAGDGDTVYVRNDSTGCDYEIQRDTRRYSDVDHPTYMED